MIEEVRDAEDEAGWMNRGRDVRCAPKSSDSVRSTQVHGPGLERLCIVLVGNKSDRTTERVRERVGMRPSRLKTFATPLIHFLSLSLSFVGLVAARV